MLYGGCTRRAFARTVLFSKMKTSRRGRGRTPSLGMRWTCEAARVGALELLQVLVEECGAHWTKGAWVAAGEEDRMDVLRWAISKHFSCAADTWCAAVRRALEHDYRPLALLHSAKRPWNETVWATAALNEEVRAWLKARGCPGSQAAAASGAGAGVGEPAVAPLV
jgi:hypothetical protein